MSTLTEYIDSREWSGGSVTFHYRLTGTHDDLSAKTLLLSSTASTYNGLVREEHPTLEPIVVDTDTGSGEWDCRIRYSPVETTPSEIGSVTITGDTTGGSQHITQSLATISKYPSSTAPDFKGAIGVTTDSVEGVDIAVPVFNFTATKVFAAGGLPSLANLYALTGKVNNASFSVTDTTTGLTITLAAGECLFNGASFGGRRTDGGVEFTYSFSASPNRTGMTVGDITGIAKKGWQYLWVRYTDAEDTTAKAIVKKPTAAYVEKVYEDGGFSGLGL